MIIGDWKMQNGLGPVRYQFAFFKWPAFVCTPVAASFVAGCGGAAKCRSASGTYRNLRLCPLAVRYWHVFVSVS